MQVGETDETRSSEHEPPAGAGSIDEPATVHASPAVTPPAAAPAPEPSPAPRVQPVSSVAAPAAAAKRGLPRWIRVLRGVALVIALPAAALGIGLLIAWIVHTVRGSSTPSRPTSPTVSSPAASPRASASAARPRVVVVVPADWIAESDPPPGLTYSHPPGWIRRTSSPEVLRLAPASPGSTAPGIQGVGAGFELAADPAQAIRDFGGRVYGSQPGFTAGAVTPVAGAHLGEQQGVLTYLRSGVDVRVVLHSFRSGTRTVLLLGRSANAQPAIAAQLEAQVEASLKVAG
jgi:hypothetical protein